MKFFRTMMAAACVALILTLGLIVMGAFNDASTPDQIKAVPVAAESGIEHARQSVAPLDVVIVAAETTSVFIVTARELEGQMTDVSTLNIAEVAVADDAEIVGGDVEFAIDRAAITTVDHVEVKARSGPMIRAVSSGAVAPLST